MSKADPTAISAAVRRRAASPPPDPLAKRPKQEDVSEEVEEVADADRGRSCPYLDTIDRSVLDFDFEKLCSISMSNINVYACLVCGKYFQGRGKKSHAYIHSLMVDHHVFLNFLTLKFYCLPDNYEIIDSSLADIKYVARPVYEGLEIARLEAAARQVRALDGTMYLPGVVGLNNIKANDYVNVVVQALFQVPPFRNFFLDERNYAGVTDPLVVSLGELVRKVYNPRAFKSHVSPHEFLQAVTTHSKKVFRLTQQSDPIEFLTWLLNSLHTCLKKGKSSVIHDIFQGGMTTWSKKIPPTADQAAISGVVIDENDEQYQEKMQETPFVFLALDLPPPPLFQDEMEANIIPQVPLADLLSKFNGISEKEYKTYKDTHHKRFKLTKLPEYILVHIKRFTKNTFFVEKNPTIVNFPIKSIDFKPFLDLEKADPLAEYKYDLLCNIVHDGLPGAGKGTYRVYIFHKATNTWFEMQDLHVREILPQMITLSESYIQIYRRQSEE
eukprot:m.624184 g.624184  ORF g.624184 m.624184 type:complete len:498 (+) comp58230_c0_seq4:285-1778(+)